MDKSRPRTNLPLSLLSWAKTTVGVPMLIVGLRKGHVQYLRNNGCYISELSGRNYRYYPPWIGVEETSKFHEFGDEDRGISNLYWSLGHKWLNASKVVFAWISKS